MTMLFSEQNAGFVNSTGFNVRIRSAPAFLAVLIKTRTLALTGKGENNPGGSSSSLPIHTTHTFFFFFETSPLAPHALSSVKPGLRCLIMHILLCSTDPFSCLRHVVCKSVSIAGGFFPPVCVCAFKKKNSSLKVASSYRPLPLLPPHLSLLTGEGRRNGLEGSRWERIGGRGGLPDLLWMPQG